MPKPDFSDQQFEDLRLSFANQIPERIREIETAWQQLQNTWNAENATHLQQLTHKLAGASLSLGYTQMGVSAQVIEHTLKGPDNTGLEATRQEINAQMEMLKKAGLVDKPARVAIVASSSAESIAAVQSLQDSRSNLLIYLVEDDPAQAQEIARQVGYFGYSVRVYHQIAQLELALRHEQPAAILMDIIFPEGDSAGTEVIGALRQTLSPSVQTIFISVRDDIRTRLKAVRAGGKAYFPKPVDFGALIDTLDRLMVVEDPLPYRILVVDDDPIQANVNALHLKRTGMETSIITDPLGIIQALHDFNPDLILLDMYMPECSGTELAVIIRQIESFVSIPIVYLSAETNREKQLEAVGLGGDDFLTKPIRPEHLISAVTSRVERYRHLRRLMTRDSLTGLLNHTTLKERYAQEINRSMRQNKPMAYAMLDLDNFKLVNDSYGHAVGDRVIKRLASMLTKRLRNTDIIGRYGGEEFAVVMPNTDSANAAQILDELRSSFEQFHHRAGNGEFTVTFSCGVASYPEYNSPLELAEAADRALYAAKTQGRNRVIG